MTLHHAIIGFIQQHGPILPSRLAKHIAKDQLMTSAHLAELTSQGKVRSSWLKIGGSPLYFLPGQESQLEQYGDNLQDKEKKAYDLIKTKKVLRDRELEPVVRVALHNLKDFAQPLTVTYQDHQERFWKWYALQNQEAKPLIDAYFPKPKQPIREKQVKQTTKTIQQKEKAIKPGQEKITKSVEQKTLPKKPIEKPQTNEFVNQLQAHFSKNNIEIVEQTIKRKAEIDYILTLPSPLGKLTYFCKAKNKKRITDTDLSAAFVQGQLQKLPVIVLSPGELSKKATELLTDLKGLTFTKL